jgi:hypothetical protein
MCATLGGQASIRPETGSCTGLAMARCKPAGLPGVRGWKQGAVGSRCRSGKSRAARSRGVVSSQTTPRWLLGVANTVGPHEPGRMRVKQKEEEVTKGQPASGAAPASRSRSKDWIAIPNLKSAPNNLQITPCLDRDV